MLPTLATSPSSIPLKPPLRAPAVSPGETFRFAPPMRSKRNAHMSQVPPMKYACSPSSVRYRLQPTEPSYAGCSKPSTGFEASTLIRVASSKRLMIRDAPPRSLSTPGVLVHLQRGEARYHGPVNFLHYAGVRPVSLGERFDLSNYLFDPLGSLDVLPRLLEVRGPPDMPLALGEQPHDLPVHRVDALPHLIEALGRLLPVEPGQDLLRMLPDFRDRFHGWLGVRERRRGHEGPQRAHRRTYLAPAIARVELRVVEELAHRPHSGVGDTRLFEPLYRLLLRKAREGTLDLFVELHPVRDPLRVRGEPRILRHARIFEYLLAEPRPLPLVLDSQEDDLPVAAVERTVGSDGCVTGPAPLRLLAAVVGEVGWKAHPLAQGFEHRDVERGALARALSPYKGGEDARVGVHTGCYIRGGDADLRGGFGGTGDRDEPGLALDQEIVGLLVPVRARSTVPGDVADDQARISLSQGLRPEAQPPGRSRREILNEDIHLC